jgi:hypothetical protein
MFLNISFQYFFYFFKKNLIEKKSFLSKTYTKMILKSLEKSYLEK